MHAHLSPSGVSQLQQPAGYNSNNLTQLYIRQTSWLQISLLEGRGQDGTLILEVIPEFLETATSN